MRPPILFLTVAFGVGLWLGLDPFAFPDGILWGAVLPLAAGSVWLASRAPVGAAVGVMAVAGTLWGRAAVRERETTCAGRWSREQGVGSRRPPSFGSRTRCRRVAGSWTRTGAP